MAHKASAYERKSPSRRQVRIVGISVRLIEDWSARYKLLTGQRARPAIIPEVFAIHARQFQGIGSCRRPSLSLPPLARTCSPAGHCCAGCHQSGPALHGQEGEFRPRQPRQLFHGGGPQRSCVRAVGSPRWRLQRHPGRSGRCEGVDAVTSVVKQMQSVVTQAQSNATANLPKLQGTRALATAGEATARGKSIYDVTMGKTLAGTAAAATRAPRAWWASTRPTPTDAAQRGLPHLQVRHRLHRHGERPRQ